MSLYNLARPALMRMDPEDAHSASLLALKAGLYPRCNVKAEPALTQKIWGKEFQSPIGLAAGFDKEAGVISQCFNLGFAFVEAGTVTLKPQSGNDRCFGPGLCRRLYAIK